MDRWILVCLVGMGFMAEVAGAPATVVEVPARAETDPVSSVGDAADDPCIWVHPQDPALSLVIGTDKKGGLAVYDLEGREVQYLPGGRPNNVDLRTEFPLGGQTHDLVATCDRSDNALRFYRVNADDRRLEPLPSRSLTACIAVYGMCLYRSRVTGAYHLIVNSEAGEVEQWELLDDGGVIDARRVRRFAVGSQTEGCVADDEAGYLFIGEEGVGVWRYRAEPDAGDDRIAVDRVAPEGRLAADVEGIAVYCGQDGTGYLVVSSQGDSTFAVYRREGAHAYVGSFRISGSDDTDEVTETDGIEACSAPLGDAFPQGLFVAQDDHNDGLEQNFKLVSWADIAHALGL